MSEKSQKYETFVEWYMRFNGYFTVNNFVVHNFENVFRDVVGNHSEVDLLGIRMPFSKEKVGNLEIKNHDPLVKGHDENRNFKYDIVIGEVKSGKHPTPNKIWTKSNTTAIEYLLRFIGIHNDEEKIKTISKTLLNEFIYKDKDCRIRFIIFAQEPNDHWQDRGVGYISFEEIIQFLVEVRGQSYLEEKLAEKSAHSQWNNLINQIFEIANKHELTSEVKVEQISDLLKGDSKNGSNNKF